MHHIGPGSLFSVESVMKKVSRFAAQPKGTYGNVAPPSFGASGVAKATATSNSASVAPSRPVKDYFDDEDDFDDASSPSYSNSSNIQPDVDDYDPLDDFM